MQTNYRKFRKFRKIQRELKQDIQRIISENNTLTFANKTTNLYKLDKEQYKKLLKDSITTTYKKVNKNIDKQINLEETNIVKGKTISNRILLNGHDECFISLKEHTLYLLGTLPILYMDI